MKCDGKCHLKKQLEKQDEQEQKSPVNVKELSETVLFLASPLIISPLVALQPLKVQYPPYSFPPANELAHSIFHPPQTV